jgi:hypothetical protein
MPEIRGLRISVPRQKDRTIMTTQMLHVVLPLIGASECNSSRSRESCRNAAPPPLLSALTSSSDVLVPAIETKLRQIHLPFSLVASESIPSDDADL